MKLIYLASNFLSKYIFKKTISLISVGIIIALSLLHNAAAAEYEYDKLGRLIKVIYNSGKGVIIYKYDAAGNRTEHKVIVANEMPIDDLVPTLAVGANLITLTSWPLGEAPSGTAVIPQWNSHTTYSNETRWSRVQGPGSSGQVTALETGQTEIDPNGGGTDRTNNVIFDKTKAYEFTIYFRKHDLTLQNLYFGVTHFGNLVKGASDDVVYTNPYFLAMSAASLTNAFANNKWYKIVGYVYPEGTPTTSDSVRGGVFDVASGAKVSGVFVRNFRWNEDHAGSIMSARFFTYYDQAVQNKFTNYFYMPSIKEVPSLAYVAAVPSISVTHVNAVESQNISFTVNLSAATSVDTKVNYNVQPYSGTDTASSNDFTSQSGALVFLKGETSKTITIPTLHDVDLEPNEKVKLTLTNPVRAIIASGQSTEIAYITNNDTVSFKVNDRSVTEGGNLTFTITKTGVTYKTHNITYATSNGTAGGSDYTAKSGTFTFSANETTKTVTVTTKSDNIYENSEILYLNLSRATGGATIFDRQGKGTITNHGSAPVFTIIPSEVTEGGILSFRVIKIGNTALSHRINFTTVANGTAVAGKDFISQSGTKLFNPSVSSLSIIVPTIQDSLYESNETLSMQLSAVTNGASFSRNKATGVIINDDKSNSAPIARDDSFITQPFYMLDDNIFDPLANDTDADGDALFIKSISGSGAKNCTLGGFTRYQALTCHFDFAGTYYVNYTVSDGYSTDEGRITFTVKSDDKLPPEGVGPLSPF